MLDTQFLTLDAECEIIDISFQMLSFGSTFSLFYELDYPLCVFSQRLCQLEGKNTFALKETDFKAVKDAGSAQQIEGNAKLRRESHLCDKALGPKLYLKIVQVNRYKAPISYLEVYPFTRETVEPYAFGDFTMENCIH